MKVLVGKVVSAKMEKTATVSVDRIVVHAIYKKRFRKSKKYHVQDDLGVKVGDVVKFAASKPYSKLKRWKILGLAVSVQKVKEIKKKQEIKTENKKVVNSKKP